MMPKERPNIQAEYRQRKADSGLKQIVIFLPERMAQALKNQAKKQGVSRSNLVVSRLKEARRSKTATSDQAKGWPGWLPSKLAKQLEADAKKAGVPPEQLAAERLALASRGTQPERASLSKASSKGNEAKAHNIAYAEGLLGLESIGDNGQTMVTAIEGLLAALSEAEIFYDKGSYIKATQTNAKHIRALATMGNAFARVTDERLSAAFGRIAERLRKAADTTTRPRPKRRRRVRN